MVPRYFSKQRGDVQTHWQAVTKINSGNMPAVVNEGRRAGAVNTTFVSRTAKYATLGLEDSVTEEARLAAQSYDDPDARVVMNLIWALMIAEEQQIIGGNNSLAFGVTPTPTLSTVVPATGQAASALTSGQTIYVYCAALSYEGYLRAINNSTAANTPVPTVSRTVVGSTLSAGPVSETVPGGVAQISLEANQAVTTTGNYINATVAVVPGAVAYAWYVATSSTAERLYGISTINSIQIGSVPTTTQLASALPASDNSYYNDTPTGVDGILTVINTAATAGTTKVMATGSPGVGTPLTANGASIVEIDAILKGMWDTYQLGPDTMWVNSQQLGDISDKILGGGAAPLVRYNFDQTAQGIRQNASMHQIATGFVVGFYLNRFGMGGPSMIDVKLHPYIPPGMILFTTQRLPYPASNVPDVMRIRGQLDYHEIAWGPFTRSAEYGVYCRETVQIFFPPAFACLNNLATG